MFLNSDCGQLILPYDGNWLYILGTHADRSRSKIGVTAGNPLLRISQLRCGDPYIEFYAAYLVPEWFSPIYKLEADVHSELIGHRIKFFGTGNYSEWFSIPPAEALKHLGTYFEDEETQKRWALHVLSRRKKPGEIEKIKMYWGKDIEEHFVIPMLSDD